MLINKERSEVGPGQFKLDPNLIRSGSLDSVIKQLIYESNIFNSEIPEIISAYEERNKIAVPAISAIAGIRKRRKATGNLTAEEDVENTLTEALNKTDEKQKINEKEANMILTEIQNGLVGKVKQEQINLKKQAKNKRKDIIDELDKLNKELLQKRELVDTNKLEETKELYNSKYHGYFKKKLRK